MMFWFAIFDRTPKKKQLHRMKLIVLQINLETQFQLGWKKFFSNNLRVC